MRLPTLEGFADGSLNLRGLSGAGLAMRPAFRVIAGRMFHAGRRELLVGTGALSRFGLGVGGKVHLIDGDWPIVGVFTDGGDILESYLVGDADTIMVATRRRGYAQVMAQLSDAGAYPRFAAWLTENPALAVSVERKTDYDLRKLGRQSAFFTHMADLIGAIMALGAMFGVVKIMYAAVRAHPGNRNAAGLGIWRGARRRLGPGRGGTAGRARCAHRNNARLARVRRPRDVGMGLVQATHIERPLGNWPGLGPRHLAGGRPGARASCRSTSRLGGPASRIMSTNRTGR